MCPRAGTVALADPLDPHTTLRVCTLESLPVAPGHTAHIAPSAHALQFHTRLAVHFGDTAGHLTRASSAHMAGLRAWTWFPRPSRHRPAHSCLQPRSSTHECTPTRCPLCDTAQPLDGTRPQMAFSLCPLSPTGHPSSPASKWSSWPLVLPGTLAAGRRAGACHSPLGAAQWQLIRPIWVLFIVPIHCCRVIKTMEAISEVLQDLRFDAESAE